MPAPPPRITAATDLELEMAVGDCVSSMDTTVALTVRDTIARGAETREALSLEPLKKSLRPTGVLLFFAIETGRRSAGRERGEPRASAEDGWGDSREASLCLFPRSLETRRGATGDRAGSGGRTHRHADALCANMAADMSLVVGLCAFDARRTCAAGAAPAGEEPTLSSPAFSTVYNLGFEQAGQLASADLLMR